MARTETVEVHIPVETYREYRDYLMNELGKREYQARMGSHDTYASNDAVAEALLADAILPHLGELLKDSPHVKPTPEGELEVVRETDGDGKFTSSEE